MRHIERDLFGEPIPTATAFRKDGGLRKIGYASRPGTGPKGQRCNTCAHCLVMQHADGRSRRCEITAAKWTPGPESDVHPNAPACRDWERKPYRKDL